MTPYTEATLHTTQRIGALAAGVLVVVGLTRPMMVMPDPASSARGLNDLWFEIQISPTLVDWFNEMALPEDIATVTPETIELLDRVTAGRKQVVFESIEEAKALVPTWADKMNIIGYELDQWPTGPAEEQADPMTAVQELTKLAERHRLELAVSLDRGFAEEYGAQLAPHLDLIVLETQRLQADPAGLRNAALPLIAALRRANPDLEISAQLYGEGSPDGLIALIHSLGNSVDGVVVIYYSSAALDVAQKSMDRLRSGQVDPAALPTLPGLEAPATSTPKPTRQAEPVVTPIPLSKPPVPAMQCVWPTAFIPVGGCLMAVRARRHKVDQRLKSKDSSVS
jgi:hypothetical protein